MDRNDRQRDLNRKYASGAEKRKKKGRVNKMLGNMKDTMLGWVKKTKKPEDETPSPSDGECEEDEVRSRSTLNDGTTSSRAGTTSMTSPSSPSLPSSACSLPGGSSSKVSHGDDESSSSSTTTQPGSRSSTIDLNQHTASSSELSVSDKEDSRSLLHNEDPQASDFSDPAYWPEILTPSVVAHIIERGPQKILDINYPMDDENRKFSASYCIRTNINGTKLVRCWLIYSKSKDMAYCFCCKLFSSQSKDFWQIKGTNKWRQLSGKLAVHDTSLDHYKCFRDWTETKDRIASCSTVNCMNEKQIAEERRHWHLMFDRIVAAIIYLAKNNLGLRGSSSKIDEKNNGNFLSLIQTFATFDPVAREHLRRIRDKEVTDHYLGQNIQNEIITIVADQIRGKILKLVKDNKYYALIVDCTRDLAKHEQMTFVLRTVTANKHTVKIKEYFIDMIHITSSTGRGMTKTILETLDSYGINIQDCRGQGYDNGANMKGKEEGVQAHIKNINSRAFFTPCACHNLNLLLGDLAKVSEKAFSFFGILQSLYNLFNGSTKRWEILTKHVKLTLKALSNTRWECRIESAKPLRHELGNVLAALHTFTVEVKSSTSDDAADACSTAQSLISKLRSFEFIVSVVIWYDLLDAVNRVSKHLQTPNMSIDVCNKLLQNLLTFFQNYRDTGFQSAILVAKEIAKKHNIYPDFEDKRVRVVPRHFDYESRDSRPANETAEDKFRRDYFYLIIDKAVISFTERLEQFQEFSGNFGFLYDTTKLKSLTLDELKKNCNDVDLLLRSGPYRDIDGAELFNELRFLRPALPDNGTLAETLKFVLNHGDFPNTSTALQIIMTIAITAASGERSFSVLKLVETYLRTTMLQQRLRDLILISIESDVADTLDLVDVREDFASKKSRKISFT